MILKIPPRNLVHYSDVIMSAAASQITGALIACSTVCSGADKKNPVKTPRQWPSCVCVCVCVGGGGGGGGGVPRRSVNSPRKGPVRRKIFQFDDVIMIKPATLISTVFVNTYGKLYRAKHPHKHNRPLAM